MVRNSLHHGKFEPTQDANGQVIDELMKQHAMEKKDLLAEVSPRKSQLERKETELKSVSEQLKDEKGDNVAILKKYVASAAAEQTCKESLALAESEFIVLRNQLEPLSNFSSLFHTLFSATLTRSNRSFLPLTIQTPEEAVNAMYSEWGSLCCQNESLKNQHAEQLELKMAAVNEYETLHRKVATYEKEVGDFKGTVTRQKSVLKAFMGRIRTLEGVIRRFANETNSLQDKDAMPESEANHRCRSCHSNRHSC